MPATDWDIYGYATPTYRDVLRAALKAHKDLGLRMDFAMGPQSGQGVPAEPDEPGLAYNLVRALMITICPAIAILIS